MIRKIIKFFSKKPEVKIPRKEVPFCEQLRKNFGSAHFSPTNRYNCRHCGACEWCGEIGHSYWQCDVRRKRIEEQKKKLTPQER